MSNHLRFSDYCLAYENQGIEVAANERTEDAMDLKDVVEHRVRNAIMTSSTLADLRKLGDAKTGGYSHSLTVRASDLADDVLRVAVRSGVDEALSR